MLDRQDIEDLWLISERNIECNYWILNYFNRQNFAEDGQLVIVSKEVDSFHYIR